MHDSANDNRCRAYKCTALAGDVFPFCGRCGMQLGDELVKRIKNARKGLKWTHKFVVALNEARVRIARVQNVPEIEIDQFMHHDAITERKYREREGRRAAI